MNVLCKLRLWSSLCCLLAKQSQVMGPSSSAATDVTQASLDRFAIDASADGLHRGDNTEAVRAPHAQPRRHLQRSYRAHLPNIAKLG
jgi:hypothetical protein